MAPIWCTGAPKRAADYRCRPAAERMPFGGCGCAFGLPTVESRCYDKMKQEPASMGAVNENIISVERVVAICAFPIVIQ